MKKNGTTSRPDLARAVLLMLAFVVLMPFLPLLIARDWNWWEAWVYALAGILGFAVSRLLAARRHPDLLGERARFMRHTDTKRWDRVLAPLVGLGGGLIPLVAGLDALGGRSGSFGLAAKISALAVIGLGYILATWALVENRFFSGVVRIQKERGHKVVKTGPYRLLRHPGYASALLTYFATPVLLDSWWTFVPVAFITSILVVRTSFEDRTLQKELPGYAGYAKRTRFRLFPGIW